MPSPSRRRRSLVRLVTVAVVGAVALGGAPTAIAFAVDAQDAAPTAAVSRSASATTRPALAATAAPSPARRSTAIQGWSAAPRSVGAGRKFRALVRVTGGERTVRLERRVGGRWKVVDTDRSSVNGAAALDWRASTSAARAVLRVHVPGTATRRAAVTPKRVVAVAPASAAAPPAPAATTKAPAPTRSAAPTTAPPATAGSSAAETLRARLLVLVNRARSTARTCGGTSYPAVPALSRSTALDTAAGAYALKMGTERFFAHESPDGSTMVSRLRAVGVSGTTMRENLAAGQTGAEAVTAGWLASPGHCANLMAADVRRIGLGHALVSGSPYGHYWVQDFAG